MFGIIVKTLIEANQHLIFITEYTHDWLMGDLWLSYLVAGLGLRA